MSTSTCFGTEVPSAGSHFNKGVYANKSMCSALPLQELLKSYTAEMRKIGWLRYSDVMY